MESVVHFVQGVGVPAAIAFFVLWRLDARLAELVKEIRQLSEKVSTVLGRSEVLEERVHSLERHCPHFSRSDHDD